MQIDRRTEIEKLTFRALALRQSECFRVSLSHRRSTTVSIETNPLYSVFLHSLFREKKNEGNAS